MIAGIYARVSTNDRGQDTGMQVREMQERCERRGWSPAIFAETGQSGTKEIRPELEKLLSACRSRKVDIVMVWALDRLARSVRQLVNLVEEFHALGIQFVVIKQDIDTTTPNGRLVFHILAAIAEFERELIRERVRSGMANARAKGKAIGRPQVRCDPYQVAVLRRQGKSWREIATLLGIGTATAMRIAQKAPKPSQKALKNVPRK